ncbi:MAG: mannitol-1-phosphate 5-dehydrogenase, partial [Candidatus Cryptobacteroides sp.]|nr:mannitol-1-phosphate 5-dehydrogenase [Candidatus Cryptobacteroides sp.]
HATLAYLGKMKGYETIGQSIEDEKIKGLVRQAMQQSGEALVKKFGFDHTKHFEYIESILVRFHNPYLKDDCNRVGRDPLRKLAANDRLILPMLTARGYGLPYDKLLLAIGACLHFDNPDDPQSVEMIGSIKERGVEGTIVKYSGILPGDPVLDEIAAAYREVEAF